MYNEFFEAMSASPMLPIFEREIFSPFHIPELEYVSIDTEDFPLFFPDPIPVLNKYPTLNYSYSIGSNEYDESEEDESSSNNESNNSIAGFELNFSAIDINHKATTDSNGDGYETFSDNESNNSMTYFELNFSDDSINPRAIECLDSSFTGEW